MNHEKMLYGCQGYLQSQSYRTLEREGTGEPFITISRQAGAGGITIGRLVGGYLREYEKSPCGCAWEVFDQNLIEKVLEDNQLSKNLKEYMPENKVSEMDDILDEILGVHPPTLTLVRKTSETVARLASLGRVVVVGRGANIITRSMPSGFHVRLVGSAAKRVKHIENYYGFSKKKAQEFVKSEDEGRKNYLKKYFNSDIDDALLYDIIINTDRVSYEEAAKIIGQAALKRR